MKGDLRKCFIIVLIATLCVAVLAAEPDSDQSSGTGTSDTICLNPAPVLWKPAFPESGEREGSPDSLPEPVPQAAVPLSMAAKAIITSPGEYQITGDYTGTDLIAIDIQSSDVVILGNGHTISGKNSTAHFSNGILVNSTYSKPLSNITISDIVIKSWDYGIDLEHCSGCVVKNAVVTDNVFHGIYLFEGSANTIKNNIIARNTHINIFLWSDGNLVVDNGIYDSMIGIDSLSENNLVTGNYIIGNGRGVHTIGEPNVYVDNLFINHNDNFENWSQPGINDFNLTIPAAGTNIIEGSRIGGNYWAFPQNTSGFSQTCPDTDNDGICDTPYTLYSGNRDAFPLAPGKDVTSLTLSAPSVAYCQVPYTLTGKLTGPGRVANLPVFLVFPNSNGFWTVTDTQGNYQFSLRSGKGTIRFNTTFPGWATSRPSNSPSATLNVLSQGRPIAITLNAPASITKDQEYTVSGYATSNGAGISVSLTPEYSWDNTTWDTIFKVPSSTISTNSAGYYSWNESNISSSTNRRYLRVRHNEDCYYVSGMSTVKTIILGGPTALPGFPNPPTDPDHDGIYEDLNANGRLDFADVVLYFNQMTWIGANEPVSAFDLNKNGRIDFADIVALFNEI